MVKARMAGKFPTNGCLDRVAINQAGDLLGGGRSIRSQNSHNLVPVGTLMGIGIMSCAASIESDAE